MSPSWKPGCCEHPVPTSQHSLRVSTGPLPSPDRAGVQVQTGKEVMAHLGPFAPGSFEEFSKVQHVPLFSSWESARTSIFQLGCLIEEVLTPQKTLFINSYTFAQRLHGVFDVSHMPVWSLSCCEILSKSIPLSELSLLHTMRG